MRRRNLDVDALVMPTSCKRGSKDVRVQNGGKSNEKRKKKDVEETRRRKEEGENWIKTMGRTLRS